MRRFAAALLALYWLVSMIVLTACNATPSATQASTSLEPEIQPAQEPEIKTYAHPGQSIRFQHIGLEDGLSQSVVMSIFQDKNGFLWFGTEDGLNRYDGYTFKVFKPIPNDATSLSDRWISDIHEGKDGSLWIGTRLGGLNRYDPQSGFFTSYLHNPNEPNSIISNEIKAIHEDTSGILWIGTPLGLELFNPETTTFTHLKSETGNPSTPNGNNITSILGDSSGGIWLGVDGGGLNYFNPKNNTFTVYEHNIFDEVNSLCSNYVMSIDQDQDGIIWAGTGRGLSRIDPNTSKSTCIHSDSYKPSGLSANQVTTVYVDQFNTLWIGTNHGLNRYDREANKFTQYHHQPEIFESLSTENVRAIGEDREGILWVGTGGGGLNKYDRQQEQFAHYRHDPTNPNSLSHNMVFPLYTTSDGTVWVGTYGGGLNSFDPVTGNFTRYVSDPNSDNNIGNNYIFSLYEDRDGMLWIGTGVDLTRLNRKNGEFTHFRHNSSDPTSIGYGIVYSFWEDDRDFLWLGTSYGLDRFNLESETFKHDFGIDPILNSLLGTLIVKIYPDQDGNLWLATFSDGVYRFNRESGSLTHFSNQVGDPASLRYDSVISIHQDKRGDIWFGTLGGGLNRFDLETDTFQVYTELDGLPNDVIYGILEDDQGYLWLSTNYGISRFNPQTETFRNYTTSDGLGSLEFNWLAYTKDKQGALYFGGINGLNVFYPEQIQDSIYLPPVVLTSLTNDGHPFYGETPAETIREVTLRWPQDSFEFEFVSLGFADPRKNEYAYKLEGYDEEWYLNGHSRTGRYTNLPGGTYTLKLIASNNDGVWNEKGSSLVVNVIPPFWETLWFQGGTLSVAALMVVGGYRVRVKQIRDRNEELEQLVRERTAEIERLFEQTKEIAVMEERNRLARDLHDSAKQKAFAALAQLGTVNGTVKTNPGAARKHLDEAENLVYEVIQELTFLIQEMYPASLKEKGLPTTVREYVFEWEEHSDIDVDLVVKDEHALELKIEQAIYRIIQETLANVARHSKATKVTMSLIYKPDMLEVNIRDNGIGFTINQKVKGVGLRSICERAESILGSFNLQSEPGKGTQVTVKVPISTGGKQ